MWHLKCGLGFHAIQGPTGENGLWEGTWGGVWLNVLKETRVAEEAVGILSMPNPGSRNNGVGSPSWDQCEGKGWSCLSHRASEGQCSRARVRCKK